MIGMIDLTRSVYDATKGLVFSQRNAQKTCNGDVVRGAVALGQFKNTLNAVSVFDNSIGNCAKSYTAAYDALAKTNGFAGGIAKCTNWASKHINPLICVSGAVRVATADDKKTEAINQSCALSGMFAVEKMTKLFQTPEGRKKLSKTDFGKNKFVKYLVKQMDLLDKISQKQNGSKWSRLGIPIMKGLTFCMMSISGYALGSMVADKINDGRKANALLANAKSKQSDFKMSA